MLNTIYYGNKPFKIKQSDVLGIGGEAVVVKFKQDLAVKLFHNPTQPKHQKVQSLIDLKNQFPSSACSPLDIVFDKSKNFSGYIMKLLSGHNEVVQKLSSRTYRRNNQNLTSKFVTELFINAYKTTQYFHKSNIIIGDYNDLNVLFTPKHEMIYIDVDSFQLPNFPCTVGTENFLDPTLYNLDLSKKSYFTANTDWYAWFVMFIRSLLLVHPYGGSHLDFPTLTQRAINRITFLDSKVKYPKIALSPDLLNTDLKLAFERMFYKGERFVPDVQIFENYVESLITCVSCNTMFPSESKHCPQCATVNTQQVQRKIRISQPAGLRKITSEKVIEVEGNILYHRLINNTIYAIALNGQKYSLYVSQIGSPQQSRVIFDTSDVLEFQIFRGNYLAVGTVFDNNLTIYSYKPPNLIAEYKTQTETYKGDRLFSASDRFLFKISLGHLFKIDSTFARYAMAEEKIIAICDGQTWFKAGTGDFVFGLQTVFNTYQYFLYDFSDKSGKGKFFNILIPSLDKNESIIDKDVFFYGSSVLYIIKTEILGRTYTRVFVIENNLVAYHYRVESINSDTHRNIHGKAFAIRPGAAIILHPTDDGIVQETITGNQIGNMVLIPETEPFVSDDSHLIQYGKGLLVVNNKEIEFLTF